MSTKSFTWTPWLLFFLFAGVGNLANGIWMLLSPQTWYVHLPGAIPDFGPYNEHFIRDLGCMFGTWGGLLLWAAFVEKVRFPIVVAITAWYSTHAFVHVYDTARGAVNRIHWVIDFPLCYAPALIFVVVLILLRRQQTTESTSTALPKEPNSHE